jgi:phosphoribosylformylglycinamidine cyclo-ligase
MAEVSARQPLTYRDAGLDLGLYDEGIRQILQLVRSTYTANVIPLENGFAGLFRLPVSRSLFGQRYQRPVLVACTDGVGTKLKVARMMGRHNTVGIDLVAMSVNDCLAVGGQPLIFLDYVALPKDDPPLLAQIIAGIVEGCHKAGCVLLGGETAILPDTYSEGDYDLVGFCVGIAEEYKVVTGSSIRPGDVLVGIASTGLHSNGYSLARKAVFERARLSVDTYVPELGRTVGEALLEPTAIYVAPVCDVLRHYRVKRVIRGLAHITGGGLPGNVERILPANCDAVFHSRLWPRPPIFDWLARLGPVEEAEMYRVFNMGLGMILVVRPYYAESVRERIRSYGFDCWIVGEVVPGSGKVRID